MKVYRGISTIPETQVGFAGSPSQVLQQQKSDEDGFFVAHRWEQPTLLLINKGKIMNRKSIVAEDAIDGVEGLTTVKEVSDLYEDHLKHQESYPESPKGLPQHQEQHGTKDRHD